MPLTPHIARSFRLDLAQARESAFKDAEAFDQIIQAIERIGSFLAPGAVGLGDMLDCLRDEVANHSVLSADIPLRHRAYHAPFQDLFDRVKTARNEAVHIGAVARHLTSSSITLALILEDGLRTIEEQKMISDCMIRNPVCAELWEPISHIRQRMLANAFTFLPVHEADGSWSIVSDFAIAHWLTLESNINHQSISRSERKRRLASPLADSQVDRRTASTLHGTTPIEEALPLLASGPVLVVRASENNYLEGILTTFDLV